MSKILIYPPLVKAEVFLHWD